MSFHSWPIGGIFVAHSAIFIQVVTGPDRIRWWCVDDCCGEKKEKRKSREEEQMMEVNKERMSPEF